MKNKQKRQRRKLPFTFTSKGVKIPGYLLSTKTHKIEVSYKNVSGYLIGVLYLSPEKLSGFNNCPFASDCVAPCLATAGRMVMGPCQTAMLDRTMLFYRDREFFLNMLFTEIAKLVRKASKLNLIPVVRLNGTSDLQWEKLTPSVFASFPMVQFFDYTKFPVDLRKNLPDNYYLLRSHHSGNNLETKSIMESGNNLAVCFDTGFDIDKNSKKRIPRKLPDTWRGFRVIDGDISDFRFLDPKGVIVGLRAKGKARKVKATSDGFVQSGINS